MKSRATLAAGVLLLLAGIIAAIPTSKSARPEGAGDRSDEESPAIRIDP